MEYIERIFAFADNYSLLSTFLGFCFSFIESFLPFLPLTGIVAVSSAINGLVIGFISSWIGSVMGTICVYFLLRRFVSDKLDKYIQRKIPINEYNRYKHGIEKKEFLIIFLYYAFPFFPSTLMTVLASSLKIDFVNFVIPMLTGKFLMMFTASYIGSDFSNIINNPTKIAVILAISLILYVFANKFQSKLQGKR